MRSALICERMPREVPSQMKTDCLEMAQSSFRCLESACLDLLCVCAHLLLQWWLLTMSYALRLGCTTANNYDRSKCKDIFEAYKGCRKMEHERIIEERKRGNAGLF